MDGAKQDSANMRRKMERKMAINMDGEEEDGDDKMQKICRERWRKYEEDDAERLKAEVKRKTEKDCVEDGEYNG